MRGATLCSGIGAPEVALPWVDWQWCAEIDKFASAVLAARHPTSHNLGDVMAEDFIARAAAHGPLDLLVAGTPCQAFSVAGARKSLKDKRGNLTLRLVEIVHAIRPRYLLWENVPWIIAGGESGSNARPHHPQWFRRQRDECIAAGVPFHHKQNGEWDEVPRETLTPGRPQMIQLGDVMIGVDGETEVVTSSLRLERMEGRGIAMRRYGKKNTGRLLDGKVWDQFPEVAA